MHNWKALVSERLSALRMNAPAEAELADELAQHLEDRYRELCSGGASDEEAFREALSEMDDMYPLNAGVERTDRMPKTDIVQPGDARRGNVFEDLIRDLRYAVRTMRRAPAFVFFVVLTLALGIGANTTVFTVIDMFILNPLPVRDAGTLVAIEGTEMNKGGRATTAFPISFPDLQDYRSGNRVFQSLAGFTPLQVLTLDEHGSSGRVFGELVTGNYFSTLGIVPARGRFFADSEDTRPGAHPVAVVSYGTWQAHFGGREDIVGRVVKINRIAFTIVGVGPRNFIGVNAIFGPDFWMPLSMASSVLPNEMQNVLTDRDKASLNAVGRFRPGVSITEARANMVTLASALASSYPSSHEGHTVSVLPIRDVAFGSTPATPILFASVGLMIVVGIVLLIACSNVANLLLARAASRRQEMAVRLALGAGSRRLVRQLLTECVLLGLMSGALGLLLGDAGLRLLFGRLPSAANFVTPKLDGTVFLFALIVSLATGILFGLIPAFKASRTSVADTLKEETRTAGRSRGRISVANTLVAGQVAFSFLLLVTAALFLRSIARAYQMDPGFQTAHLATFMTNPGQAGYTKAQTTAFYDAARERVTALPGVVSAAWSTNMPLWTRATSGIDVEGRRQRSRSDVIRAVVNTVGLDYFETAGVVLESGRTFGSQDQDSAAPVAIVNEKMAHDFWPGGALGKRIRLPGETAMRRIVGIARNANYTNWGEAPQLCIYVPLKQKFFDAMTLYVRSSGDPSRILTTVDRAVREADPQILVSFPRTGQEIVDGGLFQARMGVGLLAIFGLLALGLASIGLYGIIAYSVNQRSREIGVRMALGATPSSVRRLVLGDGMSLVGAGLVIGLLASLLTGRLLSGMLYGVNPSDPLSIGAAAVTLSTIALIACWLPARSATRVDPLTALRES